MYRDAVMARRIDKVLLIFVDVHIETSKSTLNTNALLASMRMDMISPIILAIATYRYMCVASCIPNGSQYMW